MIKKNFKYLLTFFGFIATGIIFQHCANIVTPTGGPKDEIPPVALSSSPNNYSTNFSGKTIHITFDEFVTLDNPNKNILISPPIAEKTDFKISNKTLIIKFKENLKPNTTYSINFGKAIKDLHEGNVFKDYVYTFSTGEYIDSLSFEGEILHAADLKPADEFYVMLFKDDNDTISFDSLPYFVKPNYITITDKKGKFILTGLADNQYKIFALKDGNSNMIFDLPNEEIAFVDSLVKPIFIKKNFLIQDTINQDSIILDTLVDDSLTSLNFVQNEQDSIQLDSINQNDSIKSPDIQLFKMYSFVQEDSIQKLFKKELVEDGLLRFIFRYPADNVKITVNEALPDSFSIFPIHSQRNDTILWYFTPNKDSLWVSINYDTLINDTIHFGLKPRTAEKRRRDKDTEVVKRLSINTNIVQGKLKPEQQLILSFKEPISDVKMRDTTWFITSKDTIFNDLSFEKIDEYGLKYRLNKTFEPEESYTLIFPDSVFYSFKGLTNDTTKLDFKVPEVAQFGNMYITIVVPENVPQVIVELTDEKDKVLGKRIINETQEIEFLYLNPTKYKLKAILDKDKNGIWSPGHYGKKILPEQIIYFPDILEIKANWDIDLDEPWILK